MLDEQGKNITVSAIKKLLNFLLKHTGNIVSDTIKSEKNAWQNNANKGQKSVKIFLKSNVEKRISEPIDDKSDLKKIAKSLRKNNLNFAIRKIKSEDGKVQYNILYQAKDVDFVKEAVKKHIKVKSTDNKGISINDTLYKDTMDKQNIKNSKDKGLEKSNLKHENLKEVNER